MSAIPIVRLFGIEIRAHVSWAIILTIIAVTVVAQIGETAASVEPLVRWLIGAVVAFAFLVSAVAHELGHALAARRSGAAPATVVVYFFGGAAEPTAAGRRPRDEVVAALAGPAVSLALGAGLMVVAVIGAVARDGPVAVIGQIALVVGVMNLVLGAVNLLPAFPLDGGRVVRAIAWSRTGDRLRGQRVAARVGRWLGVGAAVVGTALILIDSVDGLMLALSGWFLVSSARAVERSADVDALLEGISVADVMDHDAAGIPAALTVDTFAEQMLDGSTTSAAVTRGHDVVGVLGTRQVRRIRRDRWAQTRAADVMEAADRLPRIAPEMSLRDALDHLHRTGLDGLPVTDDGALAGVVTRRAVAEAIRDRLAARGAAS